MRLNTELEMIGYMAGIPKPLFTMIPGARGATVWRWREGGEFRDLIVADESSMSDAELRDEIARKLKSGLFERK